MMSTQAVPNGTQAAPKEAPRHCRSTSNRAHVAAEEPPNQICAFGVHIATEEPPICALSLQ